MVFLFWLVQNKSSNSALWGDLKNRHTHMLPTRHGLGHFVGKVGARRCFLYAHGAIYVGAVRVRAGHLRDSLSWRLAWNPKKPSLADSMFVCMGSKAQDTFRTSWFFVSLCCETQTGGPFSSARSHGVVCERPNRERFGTQLRWWKLLMVPGSFASRSWAKFSSPRWLWNLWDNEHGTKLRPKNKLVRRTGRSLFGSMLIRR